jgi:hypothetical protein
LIDLNSVEGKAHEYPDGYINTNFEDVSLTLGNNIKFRLNYYIDSDSQTEVSQEGQKWTKFVYNNADDLYMYMNFVEYDQQTLLHGRREVQELPKNELNSQPQYADTIAIEHVGNRFLNTVSFIQATETQPINIPKPFLAYEDQPYQAWYWKRDANTVDMIVKRSKINMNKYNQDLNLVLNESGTFIPGLRLPGGEDYGFARFNKNNGLWEIDPNYQINLTQKPNTFAYTNGMDISNKTFPQNANVYIDNGANVSISGNVTTQNGTKLYLGKDAEITVNSGGLIDATGTIFRTISGSTAPADRWKHIKLMSGNNTFTSCSFKGGEKALYVASSGNTLDGGYMGGNGTALYLNSGDATLQGVTVNDGTGGNGPYVGAKVRGSATLYTEGGSTIDTPTRFSDLDKGVDIGGFAGVVAYHTAFERNDYNVYMLSDGYFDASGIISGQGYGNIVRDPDTIYDIYNLSSNVASAQYNYWGSTTSPPQSWRFYGSVMNQNPLSCNPLIGSSFNHCSPIGSGGGGCSPMNPCQNDLVSSNTGRLVTGGAANGSDNSYSRSPRIEDVKQRIGTILAYLRDNPDLPNKEQYVRYAHSLLRSYDNDGEIREWVQFDAKLQEWVNGFMDGSADLGPHSGISTSGDGLSGASERSVTSELGQAAMIMALSDDIHNENYEAALRKAQQFTPYMQGSTYKASLWTAKAVAWEKTKQFGKALAAYEKIETFDLKTASADNYTPPGYAMIKQELADSMAARSQSDMLPAGSNTKTQNDKLSDIPESFDVGSAYPNPFNPQTTIPFNVANRSNVTIEVYNLLGRKVGVLTDRQYNAGSYEVRFSGQDLASGVYFIRAEMNSDVFSQKVTLVK